MICSVPQVLRPALQKDSNISFCSICCVLSFWNLGSWGWGTDGETISSAEAWVKEHLLLWVTTFLGHFLNRSCQSLLHLQRAARASANTPAPCVQRYAKGETWAELNQTSDLPSHALLHSFLSPLPGNQGCLCLSAPSSHSQKALGFSFHFKGGVGCCVGDGAW